MDDKEQHLREMNIGSHIAWGAAMWGSAEAAKESNNYMNAVIGYYYAVFHVGFALINTDHTFHLENMKSMKHNKIEKWLEDQLHWKDDIDYKTLRRVRENVNYLGMGEPSTKLMVVRGHQFGYDLGHEKVDFFDMVEKASESSRRIFENIFQQIEDFCVTNKWQPLQHGREYYFDEYLDEDVLLNVLPRDKDGLVALKKAMNLILGNKKI